MCQCTVDFWFLVIIRLVFGEFQMCILSWLCLPKVTPDTPQHVPLPPSCPLPTPSRFLFRNPLSYAPSQSFSVLNNETAAPCPEGSTLPVLHSYIFQPLLWALSNCFWVVLISIYWGQNESCWNTRVHLNLPGSSFNLQCKWDHSYLPNFPGYMCIQWEWFFLVHKISFVAF